ncbi:DUF2059 domain-containing protein [Curvibacter sp. APW13]|uniref:DUF2059 domain-containing protein n=1 Tax=Curvibacter sp. APW13 TaxID=3077236 RepID=UPI0028DD6A18|nr:DUF2059 domain-containing protein [Curvibacter sp. APW13]MDT8991907.1 DUF2059 domain-containing protein [Curvibacter sp. APW13]
MLIDSTTGDPVAAPYAFQAPDMSKYLFALGLVFALFTPAGAQTKQELAFELAKTAIDGQFKYLKPLLDGSLDNLKRQSRDSGKLDRVMEIWIDEMKGSMNPESFTQILSRLWAEELTQQELQQALEFMRSPAYKKLAELSESIGQPKTIAPIVKEACNRTRVRAQSIGLSTRDLDVICKQMAP